MRNNGLRDVGRSLRGMLAGLRCGRLRPARLKEPNDEDDEIIRPGRLWGSHLRCEPASGARSQTLKCLLPIIYTLFANSAADWNMQLAATRKGGGKRCSGRPRLVEINTGFCRASRSPATRRLADTRPVGFGTRTTPIPLSKPGSPAARTTLRVAKMQNDKNRRETTANEQRFSFKPPTPLRRQWTAEST